MHAHCSSLSSTFRALALPPPLALALAVAAAGGVGAGCAPAVDICGQSSCALVWDAHDAAVADDDGAGALSIAQCAVNAGCTSAPSLAPVPAAPACDTRPTATDATLTLGGESVPAFSLISDGLTAGDAPIEIALSAIGVSDASAASSLQVWLDCVQLDGASADSGSDSVDVDVASLGPGVHEIVIARDGEREALARAQFTRAHAIYVVTSVDWESADAEDTSLQRQRRLHDDHEELVITHLAGPYTFTSGLSQERMDELVAFFTDNRDDFGDEIGVHIHARCEFVEAAGVECRHDNALDSPFPDASGYAVPLADYTLDETLRMFTRARELFEANGLGTPTSFRAGGWAADADTLVALADAGFVADSSAHNWSRLEEWQQTEGVTSLYSWHQQHWSEIDDLSQPYWPSSSDAQASAADAADAAGVLEVPDNASLVDYVTTREMIEIFYASWLGIADERPRVLSIGYHAQNFSEAEAGRIDGALALLDRYRASEGTGPVVYVQLSSLTAAFPAPQ